MGESVSACKLKEITGSDDDTVKLQDTNTRGRRSEPPMGNLGLSYWSGNIRGGWSGDGGPEPPMGNPGLRSYWSGNIRGGWSGDGGPEPPMGNPGLRSYWSGNIRGGWSGAAVVIVERSIRRGCFPSEGYWGSRR